LKGGRKDPSGDGQQNTVCSETSLENDSNTRSPQSSFHLESFEGPLSAFRNYSSQDTGTATPMSFGPVPFSTPISQSQLVVPSRLLLDGSTVGGWWPASTPNGEPLSIFTPVPATTSTCRDSDISGQGPRQAQSASQVYPSSVISFHSLEQRISDRSSSIIRHVYSVLCYSMASSSGSGSSAHSSWWSRERLANESNSSRSASLGTETATRAGKRTDQESPSKRRFFLWKEAQNRNASVPLSQLSELSEGEQRIWNDMIDEARVAATPIMRPHESRILRVFMSPRSRYCCENGGIIQGTTRCSVCLSLPVHRLAGCPGDLPRIEQNERHQINERDIFDHTALHFAAASESRMAGVSVSLMTLIKLGADVLAVNTCGETFLHTLLGFVKLDELRDCLPLFQFLSTLDFPFCQRDNRGRMPLHMFFDRCQILTYQSFEVFEKMFEIMKPEIESMDNFGLTISYYFSTRSVDMLAQGRAAELLSKHRTWHNIDISFQSKLVETTGNWQIWNHWIATARRSTWVDLNGDTALIALIKYWGAEEDELLLVDRVKHLVEIGAQIHSRDRFGDTALAVASTRGFRLVVTVLLDLGASVYSCNYREATILQQARRSLSEAGKSGNDKLYASILSCIVLLVDSGAKKMDRFEKKIGQHIASWVTYGQVHKIEEMRTLKDFRYLIL
jgi:hypothetical protein